MLISSVHDPAVYDAALLSTPNYRSLLKQHLANVSRCHFIVSDGDKIIEKALRLKICNMPQDMKRYFDLIPATRYVRTSSFRNNQLLEKRQRLGECLGGVNEPSVVALSLSADYAVDVVVASEDSYVALEMSGITDEKTTTLNKYPDTVAKMREERSAQAISIEGMTDQEFAFDIVGPVVRWASNVILIDKMLCEVLYKKQSNWIQYQRTIQIVYQAWIKKCAVKGYEFTIVTLPYRAPSGEPNVSDDEQARCLADALQLPRWSRLIVKILNRNDVRGISHDRFLVTNQNVYLNFTRGFDLFGHDGKSAACCVSLCPGKNDTVSQLLKAAVVGLYEYVPPSS